VKIASVNAESAPQAAGGYSQAVAVSGAKRLLYISGQIPETPTGDVPANFASQARLVWRNVTAQLLFCLGSGHSLGQHSGAKYSLAGFALLDLI
jgi:enamine deaminase RidA (YjgF/YER057c/UK114 family)